MKTCAREGCDERYQPRTHNQKYHDNNCCRLATNARLMVQYHERQAQKRGEVRYCSICNTTKLNRYNSGKVCGGCLAMYQAEKKNSLMGMLSRVELEPA